MSATSRRARCSRPRRGAAGAVSFPQADLNHDGVVTYEEAKRVFPRLTEIQFRKNDPSGDG